ncbi:hypothetical protein PspLS_09893 [Pyricularia sp. CBS 133598]|nr:hypothetical protein PspLS_09893 [Pyricularia sp. CBS 133598]
MDRLLIVTASFSLVPEAATAALPVNRFIKDVKERHNDLDGVTTHLETITGLFDSISVIVQAMTQLLPRNLAVPAELLKQIPLTITECQTAVSKIQTAIDAFRKDKLWTRTRWNPQGKQQIEEMMKNIERHKVTLSIGLIVIQVPRSTTIHLELRILGLGPLHTTAFDKHVVDIEIILVGPGILSVAFRIAPVTIRISSLSFFGIGKGLPVQIAPQVFPSFNAVGLNGYG